MRRAFSPVFGARRPYGHLGDIFWGVLEHPCTRKPIEGTSWCPWALNIPSFHLIPTVSPLVDDGLVREDLHIETESGPQGRVPVTIIHNSSTQVWPLCVPLCHTMLRVQGSGFLRVSASLYGQSTPLGRALVERVRKERKIGVISVTRPEAHMHAFICSHRIASQWLSSCMPRANPKSPS